MTTIYQSQKDKPLAHCWPCRNLLILPVTLKDFGTAQLVFDVSCLIGQGLDDCSSSLTSRVTLHVYVTPKALTSDWLIVGSLCGLSSPNLARAVVIQNSHNSIILC